MPSQHVFRPLLHPQTPWWCEQQPDCMASVAVANVRPSHPETAGAAEPASPMTIKAAVGLRILGSILLAQVDFPIIAFPPTAFVGGYRFGNPESIG